MGNVRIIYHIMYTKNLYYAKYANGKMKNEMKNTVTIITP